MRAAAKARGALGCALSLGAAAACAAALCSSVATTRGRAGPQPMHGGTPLLPPPPPAPPHSDAWGAGEPTPRMLLEVWFPG